MFQAYSSDTLHEFLSAVTSKTLPQVPGISISGVVLAVVFCGVLVGMAQKPPTGVGETTFQGALEMASDERVGYRLSRPIVPVTDGKASAMAMRYAQALQRATVGDDFWALSMGFERESTALLGPERQAVKRQWTRRISDDRVKSRELPWVLPIDAPSSQAALQSACWVSLPPGVTISEPKVEILSSAESCPAEIRVWMTVAYSDRAAPRFTNKNTGESGIVKRAQVGLVIEKPDGQIKCRYALSDRCLLGDVMLRKD